MSYSVASPARILVHNKNITILDSKRPRDVSGLLGIDPVAVHNILPELSLTLAVMQPYGESHPSVVPTVSSIVFFSIHNTASNLKSTELQI